MQESLSGIIVADLLEILLLTNGNNITICQQYFDPAFLSIYHIPAEIYILCV